MQMVEAGQRSNTSINMSCRSDTLNMENETLDETVSKDYETQMEEVESVFGTGDHTNKLPELQEPQTLSQLQEESMGCSVTLSRLLQLATPISPSILMNLPPSYKVFVVGPESLELPNVVGSATNTGVPKFACHHCPYKAQDSRDRTKHMNSMHQVLEHPQNVPKHGATRNLTRNMIKNFTWQHVFGTALSAIERVLRSLEHIGVTREFTLRGEKWLPGLIEFKFVIELDY